MDSFLFDGSFSSLPGSKYRTDRNKKVRHLFQSAETNKKLLINSPPGSGKTEICLLLIRYIIIIKRKKVLFIPCFWTKNLIGDLARKNHKIYQFLLDNEPSLNENERETELADKLRSILGDNKTIIITDDSNMIYDDEEFWSLILKNENKIVVSFARYRLDSTISRRPSTPLGFSRQEIKCLLFTQEEFRELVDKQRKESEAEAYYLSERVCDKILEFTNGYPFLVFTVLRKLIPSFIKKDGRNEKTFYQTNFGHYYKGQYDFLAQNVTLYFRSIYQLKEVVHELFIEMNLIKKTDFLSEKYLENWLNALINLNRVPTFYFSSNDLDESKCYDATLEALVRNCVVVKDDEDRICYFYTKLHQIFYTEEYLKKIRTE